MIADNVGHVAHLNVRDTTLAFASRAPQPDIARMTARMGWKMPWYTITDDFDADHGVDEWHGTNVFFRDDDRVYRTYFINGRGDEALGSSGASGGDMPAPTIGDDRIEARRLRVLAVRVVVVPPLVRRGLRVALGRVLPLLLTSERGDVEIAPGGA